MVGAATGVYGNIAEGYCRNSLPAYINSCGIARGELGEMIGYVKHCEDMQLISGDPADQINTLLNNLWPALGGLIISLEKKRDSGDWDRSLGA
jgi:four helix bundle protein